LPTLGSFSCQRQQSYFELNKVFEENNQLVWRGCLFCRQQAASFVVLRYLWLKLGMRNKLEVTWVLILCAAGHKLCSTTLPSG